MVIRQLGCYGHQPAATHGGNRVSHDDYENDTGQDQRDGKDVAAEVAGVDA